MVTLTVHIYVFIYKSPSPYVCFFSANMTKKELLDILYAERNRLTSIYSRPGWTTWAIIVAIVSLAWYLIGPIYNHTFSVRISIAVCFALFNLLFVLGEGLFMILRPIQPQPLWQKGKPSMRYAQIYLFFIYFAQFIALIAYKEFLGPIWLYYTAITINIVTLLLFINKFYFIILHFIKSTTFKYLRRNFRDIITNIIYCVMEYFNFSKIRNQYRINKNRSNIISRHYFNRLT